MVNEQDNMKITQCNDWKSLRALERELRRHVMAGFYNMSHAERPESWTRGLRNHARRSALAYWRLAQLLVARALRID